MPALDGEFTRYVHPSTGARHFHLDAPFEDSAFLMAFLTPAPDSSGLTHVLEHLVMCGSERFPCRRAFFAMLGRTLSTTMNALTTEDCTAYHFATRSLADYENLLSVYLDAAFFPRLDRLDFDQEGCRVEIEAEGGEGEAPPIRRGVVLSEMRGLMGDPGQQLEQALKRCLFPGTPYRFNAGGDPWEIPALDHEALRAYHRRHYHPANAVFLSAGPLRPEWLHVRLQELALGRFPHHAPRASPRLAPLEVPRLEAPSRFAVHYPVADAAGAERAAGGASGAGGAGTAGTAGASGRARRGAGVALAWRLGEASDPMAAARARLLARCLLEQGDAPLRRALLEASGSPAVAFGSSAVQATGCRLVFRCGVHDCDPDLAGAIEARVLAAIDGAARGGLERAHVDGAFAGIERDMRERHDPRYPFPLKLLTRMLPAALYGGEPVAALDAAPALAALRTEIRSREGVAALVRRCLRDNPERVSVTAIPDPAAARRLDAADRALLMQAYGPSCPEARRRIIDRSRALRRRQASSSGESSLPRLGLDAVGPARERPELSALPSVRPASPIPCGRAWPGWGEVPGASGKSAVAEAPAAAGGRGAATARPRIWLSRGATGGLVYGHLAIDVPDFEIRQLDDVGLLGEILPQSGHGGLGPAATRARLARFCDRLAVEPRILARAAPGPDGFGSAAPRAVLLLSAGTQAADENVLLQVLADARFEARFDPADARAAAAKARACRRRDLARNGHLHAEWIAAARLDPWAAVAERWHGPGALAILDRAAEDGNGDGPLAERLHHVHRALAAAPYQLLIVRDHDRDPGSGRYSGEQSDGEPANGRSMSGEPDRVPARPALRIPAPAMQAAPRMSGSTDATGPERRELPPVRAAPCRTSATGAWIVDSPVNHCAKVYPAVAADHPDTGPLAVAAAFLGGDLLQRAVRERGGAYGAGARYCARTRTLRMFSYRDPRLGQTLRDFDAAIEALCRRPPEGRRLEEAVLRTVREIDKPRAFRIDALERYLDEFQGRGSRNAGSLRSSVLGVEPGRLREVAERYLVSGRGCAGVLAGAGSEAELDRLEMPWRRL